MPSHQFVRQVFERGFFFLFLTVIKVATFSLLAKWTTQQSISVVIKILILLPIVTSLMTLGTINVVPVVAGGNGSKAIGFCIKSLCIVCVTLVIFIILRTANVFYLEVQLGLFLECIVLVSFVVRALVSGVLLTLNKTSLDMFMAVVSAGLLLCMLVIFKLFADIDERVYLTIFAVTNFIAALGGIYGVRKLDLKGKVNFNFDKKELLLSSKGLSHVTISNLRRRIDYLIVFEVMSIQHAAIYGVMTQFAQYLISPIVLVGQIVYTYMAREDLSKKINFSLICVCVTLFMTLICLVLYFMGEMLWGILFGEKYRIVAEYFPYYAPYIVLSAIESIYGYYFSGKGYPLFFLVCLAAGTLLVFVCGPYALSSFGIPGLSLALAVISLAVISAITFDALKKSR